MRNSYIRSKNRMPDTIMLKEANAYNKIKKLMANKEIARFELLSSIEQVINETEKV